MAASVLFLLQKINQKRERWCSRFFVYAGKGIAEGLEEKEADISKKGKEGIALWKDL